MLRRAGSSPSGGTSGRSSATPKPQAAVMARIATPAKAKPIKAEPAPLETPSTVFAAPRSASPTTPPSPVGKGQRPVAGSALATAVAAPEPPIHSASRRCRRRTLRERRSCQPQTAIGVRSSTDASPKSCIARSATIAPGSPRRLRTVASVALLRLGSSTDQVASAVVTTPARPIRPSPQSSAARRLRKARNASEKFS